MKRKGGGISGPVLLLVALGLTLASCDNPDRYKIGYKRDPSETFLCEVSLRVPQSPSVYKDLYSKTLDHLHLVCPFDYRTERIATLYLLTHRNECFGSTMFGYPIGASSAVDNLMRGFRSCSDLLSANKSFGATKVDAYLWIPKRPLESVDKAQNVLSNRVHYAIGLAGLPIIDQLPSNVGTCFEEKAGTNLSPAALLHGVGVDMPDWESERLLPGKSCDEAIGDLMDSSSLRWR